MATTTILAETLATSAAAGDYILYWDVAGGYQRRITKANFIGAILSGGYALAVQGNSAINGTLSGGGMVDTNGYTLDILANGTLNGSLLGGYELTLGADGTLTGDVVGNMTGGGTLATGGFTLTVPATGTVDLLDTAQTISALKTFTAAPRLQLGWYSHSQVINDDAYASFPCASGFAMVLSTTDSAAWGLVVGRPAATVFCASVAVGAQCNVTTGALAGTTGADGKLTISMHSDGNLYVENRRGSNLAFKILLMG